MRSSVAIPAEEPYPDPRHRLMPCCTAGSQRAMNGPQTRPDPPGRLAMGTRTLVVRRSHRGCALYDDGRPLAWYPSLDRALAMARLLADAAELRTGHAPPILVGSYGQPPAPLPVRANGSLPGQC